MTTTRLKVTDMDCPDCVSKVERGLGEVAGVSSVSVSLMSQMVTVSHAGIGRPALVTAVEAAGYSVAADGGRAVFAIPDMECAGCAEKVERALRDVDGVLDVVTRVMSQKVTVSYDPGVASIDRLTQAIQDADYTVGSTADDGDAEGVPFWRDRERVLTLLSGLFFFSGLIVSWTSPEQEHGPLWEGHLGLSGALYLTAAVFGGCNFFAAGFRSLRTLTLDMEFLMMAAIVGAALVGEHMEAAAIAFLFSTAELLEDYAIGRARNSLRSLMELAPETATVKRNGQEVVVPVGEVEVDERVVVRPGDRVPVDGRVVEGATSINQAPITGESMPVEKSVGDEVFAGTINAEGDVEVQAARHASESTLARIIQLVEEAEEHRAPSEQFVRRFSRYYTPVVTVMALGIMLIPTLVGGADFVTWFVRGLALLVIACPCALVISTPVAVVSGITSAARNGVLIKGGTYLEALADVKVVAFDKTGTLTHGRPKVTDVISLNGCAEDEVLRIAAALESRSQHPVGRAIVARANGIDLPSVTSFESITGQGVSGEIDGVSYRVGRSALFPDGSASSLKTLQAQGKTAVLVGTSSEVLGMVAVADTVRDDARETVAALHRQGIRHVVMLTGDNEATAAAIAAELGVDEYRAELLPEDKVEAVRDLQSRFGSLAMVGDGVNDAPALATATVGIAMGAAGTDTALETADAALMADDLSKLPYLFRLSRKSRRVIRQNVSASILIKIVLAAGVMPGLVTLVVAVLVGDMGTSLGVTANALRLARVKPEA